MKCTLSACEQPPKFEVTFDTGDIYVYCDYHGWRWSKGWINRGAKRTRVAGWRFVGSNQYVSFQQGASV